MTDKPKRKRKRAMKRDTCHLSAAADLLRGSIDQADFKAYIG